MSSTACPCTPLVPGSGVEQYRGISLDVVTHRVGVQLNAVEQSHGVLPDVVGHLAIVWHVGVKQYRGIQNVLEPPAGI